MKRILFLTLALLGTQVEAKHKHGHGHNVGFSFSFGNPYFGFTVGRPSRPVMPVYHHAPVVYQPMPMVYAPCAPVYSPFGFFGF